MRYEVSAGFRRCAQDKCWRPVWEFDGGGTGSAAICEYCSNENVRIKAQKKRKRENEENRTAARGACRVKEVKARYGHMCEIPIQAYREAGVAHSRNDYVTDQDVQAASDAWDARSVAHAIDTQWGAMPMGGAYKDSNHYWGPGEYDF